jgi:hypothetical protein
MIQGYEKVPLIRHFACGGWICLPIQRLGFSAHS